MASVAALIDRGLARVQGSTIVRQGVVVFAASMILNLGGFIFHAVASRRIGVVDYGVLYALISTSTILAIPANLAAPVVARFAAEFRVLHDERHIRRLVLDVVRFFGAFAIVYLVVSVVLMKPAATFLNAPIWPAPFVALIGGTLLMSGVLRAVAQGTQDYTGFARSCMADGVAKVIGVLAFTALGFTLFGTVAGFLSGALGGAVAIGIRLFRNYGTVEHCVIRYDWRRIAISGIGAAAITVAAALMGSADVILIKHYFDANLAGVYSAASLCGKIFAVLRRLRADRVASASRRAARPRRKHSPRPGDVRGDFVGHRSRRFDRRPVLRHFAASHACRARLRRGRAAACCRTAPR